MSSENVLNNIKNKEERKAVEDSDHKLTEELFSNIPNIPNPNIPNPTVPNPNIPNEKSKKTKQFLMSKKLIRKNPKKQPNDMHASIYDEYYDLEDKFLK